MKMAKPKCDFKTPRLYVDTVRSLDDIKEAAGLLNAADIPHYDFPVTEARWSVQLQYGWWEYHGLNGVKEFIKSWKDKKLPPLYAFQKA